MSVDSFVLSAVYTDETPLFRFPSEPDPGDNITIRLRVAKDSASRIIVLFDTLIEKLSSDEICAVFAHELGHGLHKDTLKGQLMNSLQMIILSVLAWLTLRTTAIFTDCGFDKVNYGFAVILIMAVEFALIAPLFGILANYFSRRHEYRADDHGLLHGERESESFVNRQDLPHRLPGHGGLDQQLCQHAE